jgi:hypothetical protein
VRYIQWAQDQPIHHSEDHGVGANRERQRQNGGDGESGRFAQLALGESKILQQGDHGRPPG